MIKVVWTEYLKYRVLLRGFEPAVIEQIVRSSAQRYFDSATQRMIAVGRHDDLLVMIPYDQEGDTVTPVTIHSTSRQQISFRLRTGRFRP